MKLILSLVLVAGTAQAKNPAGAIISRQGDDQFTSQPTEPSIYDSAAKVQKENQKGQKQAQMISMALNSAGMRMVAACCGGDCHSTCRTGIALIVMGGLASMQAKGEGKTANQAGMTMGATDAFGEGYNNGKTVGASGSGFSQIGDEMAKTFADKKIPVTFDGKKFVGRDGKKLGPEDEMSASSMAGAGLSKDQIASISAEVSKANKAAEDKIKLTTPNFGFSEGGGGGAYGKGGSGGDSGADGANGLGRAGQATLSSINSKAATSGLTKDYHGDPIGVSNDSIFSMMTKRYQLKDHQDSFIISSPAAVQK